MAARHEREHLLVCYAGTCPRAATCPSTVPRNCLTRRTGSTVSVDGGFTCSTPTARPLRERGQEPRSRRRADPRSRTAVHDGDPPWPPPDHVSPGRRRRCARGSQRPTSARPVPDPVFRCQQGPTRPQSNPGFKDPIGCPRTRAIGGRSGCWTRSLSAMAVVRAVHMRFSSAFAALRPSLLREPAAGERGFPLPSRTVRMLDEP
jgi:hypothetical protein